jgi:hypothetical protein
MARIAFDEPFSVRLPMKSNEVALRFMALIFEVEKDGRGRPKIRCDCCGGVIENYGDGVALLDTPSAPPGTLIEPIFHCANCEAKVKETSAPRRSMPIDRFMLYVLNNIQLTPKALEEAGRSMEKLTG